MIDALTDLRERGDIPWAAIVDETRSVADFTGWPALADGVGAFVNAARLDPWDGDAPLILTESRSLAGVLRALTRNYAAMIAPTNGQVAGFLHNDVAPRLTEGTRVLYLGDYDRAGNDIEVNTQRVLERYRPLRWERLALTADQVNDPRYSLTPIVKTDRRCKDGGEHEAVETEALSQATIVQIVRDRLDALLPEPLEENVVGAPLINPITLCGTMFGLATPCGAEPRPTVETKRSPPRNFRGGASPFPSYSSKRRPPSYRAQRYLRRRPRPRAPIQ